TCSIASATSAMLAVGRGCPARQVAISARTAAESFGWRRVASAVSEANWLSSAYTALDVKLVTNGTMTTPPFFGTRARIESGTLRGWSTRARAAECEKITGAAVTSSALLIVPGDTCERS